MGGAPAAPTAEIVFSIVVVYFNHHRFHKNRCVFAIESLEVPHFPKVSSVASTLTVRKRTLTLLKVVVDNALIQSRVYLHETSTGLVFLIDIAMAIKSAETIRRC